MKAIFGEINSVILTVATILGMLICGVWAVRFGKEENEENNNKDE